MKRENEYNNSRVLTGRDVARLTLQHRLVSSALLISRPFEDWHNTKPKNHSLLNLNSTSCRKKALWGSFHYKFTRVRSWKNNFEVRFLNVNCLLKKNIQFKHSGVRVFDPFDQEEKSRHRSNEIADEFQNIVNTRVDDAYVIICAVCKSGN